MSEYNKYNRDNRAKKSPDRGPKNEVDAENCGIVIGRNGVRELLRSDRSIDKIMIKKGELEGSVTVLVAEALSRGIPVIEVEKAKLDSVSGFAPHQGIIQRLKKFLP